MPSRAYTSFLRRRSIWFGQDQSPCQCPLGLIPHFYANDPDGWDMLEDDVSMPSRAYTSFLLSVAYGYKIIGALLCQCPLGLIPHFYNEEVKVIVPIREVSMPSRAYTSFLRYPFKNLGFMRFPEPVFAGIYQNILTTAVFRAC